MPHNVLRPYSSPWHFKTGWMSYVREQLECCLIGTNQEINQITHFVFLLSLIRHIFRSNEKSVQLYPCFHDEWTKMCYDDYCVTYPDQPMNSWFIVFRYEFVCLFVFFNTLNLCYSTQPWLHKITIAKSKGLLSI